MNEKVKVINKCCKFLLPLYNLNYKEGSLLSKYLVNCYIKDYNYFIIFDNNIDDTLLKIINLLENDKNYLHRYLRDNETKIIIVMQIPEYFYLDYELFLAGKYTLLSKEYKDLLCNHYGNKVTLDKDTNGKPIIRIFDVIYPTNEKYQQYADYLEVDVKLIKKVGELLDSPDMKKETLLNIYE